MAHRKYLWASRVHNLYLLVLQRFRATTHNEANANDLANRLIVDIESFELKAELEGSENSASCYYYWWICNGEVWFLWFIIISTWWSWFILAGGSGSAIATTLKHLLLFYFLITLTDRGLTGWKGKPSMRTHYKIGWFFPVFVFLFCFLDFRAPSSRALTGW